MIVVVDPGAATTNLGDKIISEAVSAQLIRPLTEHGNEVRTIPMHGHLSDDARDLLRAADEVVVSGTNLLSDHMRFRRSWQWEREDIELTRGKLTMFGVGWWQYQRTGIDAISARWLRDLSSGRDWALRDEYSVRRLRRAGVDATHTTCPTLWDCFEQRLPGAEDRVVVTLTDYNQERAADEWLVRLLHERYRHVAYWPQGPGDETYIRSLPGTQRGEMLVPTVNAFDEALTAPSTAYVGLRLHGGVRAIQHGVPSLILSVDNRASEISLSVDLAAPSRFALAEISAFVGSGQTRQLRVPRENINNWRATW